MTTITTAIATKMMTTPTTTITTVTAKNEDSNNTDSYDSWRIALYYCYFPIVDVERHISFQNDLCVSKNLNGRVRVSSEGINGVLSGEHIVLKQYEEELRNKLLLSESINNNNNNNTLELDIKYCRLRTDLPIREQLFNSLSVKETSQVVSLYEKKDPSKKQQGVSSKSNRYYRRRKRSRKKHEKYNDDNNNQQRRNVIDDDDDDDKKGEKDEEDNNEGKMANPSEQQHHHNDHHQNYLDDLDKYSPAQHLSPLEWNQHLKQLPKDDVILLDARNVYESRVGYFAVDGVQTLLTNTRKFSTLPTVMQSHAKDLSGKHIFMYCTGGVRCEQASVCLQAISAEWEKNDRPKGIYQLHGGIQKYLERYGVPPSSTSSSSSKEDDDDADNNKELSSLVESSHNDLENNDACSNNKNNDDDDDDNDCLYKGKNFVFDPRRTDGVIGATPVVGHCIVCKTPHDDYDNGHAPCQNKEARCCRCRILILVCNTCRENKVRCWGEEEVSDDKVDLFCGGLEKGCIDQGNAVEQVEIIHYTKQ